MVSGSKSGSNFNSPEFDLRHFNSQFSQNHTIVVDLLVTYSIFLIFPFSHSGTIFYKTTLPCKTLSYQKHFLSSGVYFCNQPSLYLPHSCWVFSALFLLTALLTQLGFFHVCMNVCIVGGYNQHIYAETRRRYHAALSP